MHISASDLNKYKTSDIGLESTNVQSQDNSEQENAFLQRTDLEGEEKIESIMNQDIGNQMSEHSYSCLFTILL